MDSLLKRLKFLNHRYIYISVILMIVFTLLVYPPSVGNAKPQGRGSSSKVVYKSPLMFTNSTIDSLRAKLIKTDSSIDKVCTKIVKQQETIKTIITKQ